MKENQWTVPLNQLSTLLAQSTSLAKSKLDQISSNTTEAADTMITRKKTTNRINVTHVLQDRDNLANIMVLINTKLQVPRSPILHRLRPKVIQCLAFQKKTVQQIKITCLGYDRIYSHATRWGRTTWLRFLFHSIILIYERDYIYFGVQRTSLFVNDSQCLLYLFECVFLLEAIVRCVHNFFMISTASFHLLVR